jgi:RHS repeat-associated protein
MRCTSVFGVALAAVILGPRVADAQTYQFRYDGFGGRLQKITPTVTTSYPLGDNYEVTGGVVTKYIKVEGEVVAKRVGATTTYWIQGDNLESVGSVANQSGASVQAMAYAPYGARLSKVTSFPESLGYIGQRQDETGLIYLHARYYDAQLARMLAPDRAVPGSHNVALNRYAYSFNDPINYSDRSGNWPGDEQTMAAKPRPTVTQGNHRATAAMMDPNLPRSAVIGEDLTGRRPKPLTKGTVQDLLADDKLGTTNSNYRGKPWINEGKVQDMLQEGFDPAKATADGGVRLENRAAHKFSDIHGDYGHGAPIQEVMGDAYPQARSRVARAGATVRAGVNTPGGAIAAVGIVKEAASLVVPQDAVEQATRNNLPYVPPVFGVPKADAMAIDGDKWFWDSDSHGGWTGMRKTGNVFIGLWNSVDVATVPNFFIGIGNLGITAGQGYVDAASAAYHGIRGD